MKKKFGNSLFRKRAEEENMQQTFCSQNTEVTEEQISALLQGAEETPQRKGRGRKKIILIAGAFLLCVFLLRSCIAAGNKGALPVVTEALRKGNIQEKLSVSGPVSGTDSAEVVSGLHAEVKEVLVKEGEKVSKGQALAYLDETDAKQAVAVAENQLKLALANKEEARKQNEASYSKAKQALEMAQADMERKQILYAAGDIARSEFEQSQSALEEARAVIQTFTLEQGKPVLGASYDLQIENAEYELAKAREDFAQTTVKSPIDGTVTRVNTKVGQFADKVDGTTTAMFSIENLDHLELEIRISEYSIGKVSVGQKAEITADIMDGKKAEGEVVSISPTGEAKNSSSSERVIPTQIRIDSTDSGLISGITAKAEIVLDEAEDAYIAPLSALMTMSDGKTVLAFVRNGQVSLSEVTTGVESDLEAEVIPVQEDDQNFTEGARLIAAPDPGTITEGVKVQDSGVAEGTVQKDGN